MSLGSVMARIGEIQTRFGVSASASTATVGVADFAGLSANDVVELATAQTEKLAGAEVASALQASLLDALSVRRGDAGLATTGTVFGTDSASTSFDGSAVFPLSGYSVGSAFGLRNDPIEGDVRMHKGVDIAAPQGTPIVAAGAGEVTWAGPRGTYGNLVVVAHDDATETRYAHQARVLVEPGDRVARGQIIGEVGSTGKSTGPHLHFETRVNGEAIDPVTWLRDHELRA